MIGRITLGRSFYGCIAYCLEDKKLEQSQDIAYQNRADLLDCHQCFGSKVELAHQFEAVRKLNRRAEKPVLHIVLSLSPAEHLERHILVQLARECAQAMGVARNQYIAVHHRDTDHQHLHLVANRVGFDGRVVSDAHNYQKMAAYCRNMEVKYGLQAVLSPRRFLRPKERLLPRQDVRKQALKAQLEGCLKLCKSWSEVEQHLREQGYKMQRGKGIVFLDEKGVRIKGSAVGYSLATLERVLQQQHLKQHQIQQQVKECRHQLRHHL